MTENKKYNICLPGDFKCCVNCGKEFYVPIPSEWVYKINKSGSGYCCSWSCFQNYKNKTQKRKYMKY